MSQISSSRNGGWCPTPFNIAELRVSRKLNQPDFVLEIIHWGVQNDVYFPMGVISDSISFVYR